MNILELWEVDVHGVCFMLTVLSGYNKKHDIVFIILLLTLDVCFMNHILQGSKLCPEDTATGSSKMFIYHLPDYKASHAEAHDIQCRELSLSAFLLASLVSLRVRGCALSWGLNTVNFCIKGGGKNAYREISWREICCNFAC
jgi:hypothetical protein